MADPFIGEIRIFAGNFAPSGWAFCDGQLLAVSQNDALFSLFGTMYGGDGRTTFGLPDLRGRIPIHQGQGPGLTNRRLGEKAGSETSTVSQAEMPSHTHAVRGTSDFAGDTAPANNLPATVAGGNLYSDASPGVALAGNSVEASGGGQPHANLMPFKCIHFIVALFGVYPSRT